LATPSEGDRLLVRRIDDARAGPSPRPEYFTGRVRWQMLSDPERNEVEVLAITFEAGARSRPHVHPAEEVLHVISGEGVLVMEKDHVPLRAGDIVVVPAGHWHWHGASHSGSMQQLVIGLPGATDWNVPEDMAASVKSGWRQ
jgi:quercetin dioxygenase-like cupin family protein